MLMEFKNSKQEESDRIKLKNRYFNEILANLNAREIYDELGDNALLLCFEKDFCHRHFIAEWFYNELGINVEEWKPEPPKEDFHQITFEEYF